MESHVSTGIICTILIIVLFVSSTQTHKGAVVSNEKVCAEIGRGILEKGGTAADAIIAVLLCEGATLPSCLGLGGGFLLTYYDKSSGKVICLNSRETAPAAATENMYKGNRYGSQLGGSAVAVPSELIGYWHLYNRFGKGVTWAEIFQPVIELCEKGFPVNTFSADSLTRQTERLCLDPVLRELTINPKTRNLYKLGETITRPRLAKTLRIIAREGGMALHAGSLTKAFVKEVQKAGGILTVEDMRDYKPLWVEPIESPLEDNYTLYSIPLPGSGAVLAYILNILENFMVKDSFYKTVNLHRLIEAMKFAYGARTKFGDSDTKAMRDFIAKITSKEFAKEARSYIYDKNTFESVLYYGANATFEEDHGTANMCVLAPNGDAVAVSSTINGRFGAFLGSCSTGILLNNEMDDFSLPGYQNMYGLPPSPANFIKPGRRPVSSMTPTIILDQKGRVVMMIGGAGGSKITTTAAQIIVKHLWFGMDLDKAMQDVRFHHQLMPNVLLLENAFKDEHPDIVEGLEKIGHDIHYMYPRDGFTAVTSISNVEKGKIVGSFDKRRGGGVEYL